MQVLVVLYCLAGAPVDSLEGCERQTTPLLAEVTPFMCNLKAQEKIAQQHEHWEGWNVRRWGCFRPERAKTAFLSKEAS